jgi:SHS2 domain-containing protein
MADVTPPLWETFSHDADIGVRGYGATPEEAFINAALAMMSVVTDPDGVRATICAPIACSAPDMETLFVDWLNAIVLEMAAESLVFGRFDVAIEGNQLTGAAWGEPLDMRRHQPTVEIKGATYTSLEVAQDKDGRWRAQCVVDV